MPALTIIPNADEVAFTALREAVVDGALPEGRVIHLGEEAHIEVGGLASGMRSGAPSCAFCFALPDGRVVVAETSLALFLSAADALKAAHGDPR